MEMVYFEEASFEDSELGNAEVTSEAISVGKSRALLNAFSAVQARFDAKTRITNIEFRGAELRNAQFNGTRLTGVLFIDSDLSSAHFDGVDFASVSLVDVDLSGADLSKSVNLSQKILAGACGTQETKLPPGLKVNHCRPRRRA
ncbi:MAG: pentapeptide repeat-containing protein [Leptothrix sp. (in: b-proteobacteria)]